MEEFFFEILMCCNLQQELKPVKECVNSVKKRKHFKQKFTVL